MTLRNSPLAIDGARIDSATLRIAAFANASGNPGIINKGDLKVAPLDTPGNGIKVAHGAGILLNRYQSSIDQAYVVSNVNEAVLDSSYMPASSPSAASHLVVVTVGDPEFGQTGHPWMQPTDPPAGQEETFQYVRFHVIPNVPSTADATYVDTLPYPALALARLDMPSNTTTVSSAEIVDLRELANPRSREFIEHIGAAGNNLLNGAGGVANTWENWPGSINYQIKVPYWAVRAKVTGFLEGIRHTKAGSGALRVEIEGAGTTTVTNINESAPSSGDDRKAYSVGGEINIPANLRGTTVTVRMQGKPNNAGSQGFLKVEDGFSSGQIRVRLEEERT